MDRKPVYRRQLSFLNRQSSDWVENQLITEEQRGLILVQYQLKQLNFVRILLAIGALLVGLGIMSFIASNWAGMGRMMKYLVIVGFYAGACVSSYLLEERYPKTSRSLLYIGGLIFGAGIFLVGQIFNLSGNFSAAFLLWGIGLLPFGVLYRDRVLLVFSHILLLINILGGFDPDARSFWYLLYIPGLYGVARYLGNSLLLTAFTNLLLLAGIGNLLAWQEVTGMVASALYLVLGALMVLLCGKAPGNTAEVWRIEGGLTFGIAGLFLTGKGLWAHYALFGDGIPASIVFAVAFVVVLLGWVRRGSLMALVFLCGTILRFYFDTFFDFMPKSLFFVIGGAMLLGFGFYFERMRKGKGGAEDAEE